MEYSRKMIPFNMRLFILLSARAATRNWVKFYTYRWVA